MVMVHVCAIFIEECLGIRVAQFLTVKRSERCYHSTPTSAEVKKIRNYKSIPPHTPSYRNRLSFTWNMQVS
jgi:hypothetical protein